VTLVAVVALTLAACGSGTSDTTTTEDTRGWSDEAFRDLMTYCQAAEFPNCASLVIGMRDTLNCSVEAAYRIVDVMDSNAAGDERREALTDLVDDAGDCLPLLLGLDE